LTISQVCETYHALVYRYARHYTRDPDDLVQDVMLKVLRFWTPDKEQWTPDQVKSWMWQITRRTAIDLARHAKLHTLHNQELTDCHYASSDVESHIEACEIITVALSRLPERDRVLLLLDAQGYTDDEIAERVQTTRGSVKSRLHRARGVIREVAA
jgi:RNA polymerase sigma factor (sigma-70 family)